MVTVVGDVVLIHEMYLEKSLCVLLSTSFVDINIKT